MKSSRPGKYAVRAINQYRRRDVVAYLGLRYYLDNTGSRSDIWAKEVAVDQVLRRNNSIYFKTHHYKEIDSHGKVVHREMILPSPTESITEAVLIDACISAGGAFKSDHCVYSYEPAQDDNTEGIYKNYIHGLKRRHSAISSTCRDNRNIHVGFYDIKRFYPSITYEIALSAWKSACEESGLDIRHRELGEKLLRDQSNYENKGHILTGPMFSHLIANLVLRGVDRELQKHSARYVRYVDDVALIGTKDEVHSSFLLLKSMLDEIGLELHDENSDKSIFISAEDWLVGEGDYSEPSRGISWMTLIGDLKRLLLWHPEDIPELRRRFQGAEIRIPLLDYSVSIQEVGYIERQAQLIMSKWFVGKIRRISPSNIIIQAVYLRNKYYKECLSLMDELSNCSVFNAKRIIPKIRYRINRLTYLGTSDQLLTVYNKSKDFPSLYFQSEIALAVATKDVNQVIKMGSNAAQAAAQPLKETTSAILVDAAPSNHGEEQAISIFALNGLVVAYKNNDEFKHSDFYKFSTKCVDISLYKSSDGFVKDISCLHGLSADLRHSRILSTAFDRAEDIALDAIDQARNSFSI